jgi:hypothetical protein
MEMEAKKYTISSSNESNSSVRLTSMVLPTLMIYFLEKYY